MLTRSRCVEMNVRNRDAQSAEGLDAFRFSLFDWRWGQNKLDGTWFPQCSHIGSTVYSSNNNRHAGTPNNTKTKDTMSLGTAQFRFTGLPQSVLSLSESEIEMVHDDRGNTLLSVGEGKSGSTNNYLHGGLVCMIKHIARV